MARIALRNIPPGFTDEEIVQELNPAKDLIIGMFISRNRLLNQYSRPNQCIIPRNAACQSVSHVGCS